MQVFPVMTCLMAVAIPSMALVAADPRLNVQFRDGGRGGRDAGTVDFAYPDGSVSRVGATKRKIRRLCAVWAGGAACFPLVHRSLEELAEASSLSLEPAQVAKLVRSACDAESLLVRAVR